LEKINKLKFRFNKLFYFLLKERFNKTIDFSFPKNINRWDLIKDIINLKGYKSYLELGCDDDHSFDKIKIDYKIGVDPYSGGNFKGTSDFFFSQNKRKFDCIFIDGLHEYKQVCKDIQNSLDCLEDNGIILLHDSLPATIHQQAVPRYKIIWNGDVWKAVVNFRTKLDCDIVTCKIDHGVSVVRKVKNKKKLEIDIKNFQNLKFEEFYNNYENYLRVLDYENVIKYIQN